MKKVLLVVLGLCVIFGAWKLYERRVATPAKQALNAAQILDNAVKLFEAQGMKVAVVTPTGEEAAYVAKANEAIDSLRQVAGVEAGDTPVLDSLEMAVDAVPVKITVYRDEQSAKKAYDILSELGRTGEKIHPKERTEYVLNRALVLDVSSYNVVLENNRLRAVPLDLDPVKVAAIKTVFSSL